MFRVEFKKNISLLAMCLSEAKGIVNKYYEGTKFMEITRDNLAFYSPDLEFLGNIWEEKGGILGSKIYKQAAVELRDNGEVRLKIKYFDGSAKLGTIESKEALTRFFYYYAGKAEISVHRGF